MSNPETNSGLDFIESPEGLANELGKVEKVLTQNRKGIYIAIGAIAAVILGFFAYNWYTNSQDEEAQAAMFAPVLAFEADSLNKALKGTANSPGLTKIADDYGSTASGKLAHFYVGTALLKQGKFDEAIEQLKSFSSSDLLVQARAYSLIGDAYMEKNAVSDAIGYYEKAVDYKPNAQFTPSYMMKLAIAHEKAKENKEAIEVYANLLEKYPTSAEALNAKKYMALLETE
jgi:TolA-binding protein